jgi:hypothetical protein
LSFRVKDLAIILFERYGKQAELVLQFTIPARRIFGNFLVVKLLRGVYDQSSSITSVFNDLRFKFTDIYYSIGIWVFSGTWYIVSVPKVDPGLR